MVRLSRCGKQKPAEPRRNSRRRTVAGRCWSWRVACHAGCLAVVLVAVTRVSRLLPEGRWNVALGLFGEYSGMGSRYGFYAPRPGLPRRLVARLYRPATRDWHSESIDWGGREAMLHVQTMYHHFQEGNFLREYAASWAAWYFGQHPDTAVAVIEEQVWNLPPLRASRARPHVEWVSVKLYSFVRTGEMIVPESASAIPE